MEQTKLNKKHLVLLSVLSVIVVLAFAMAVNIATSSTEGSEGIAYHSSVCKTLTRADGSVEDLGCDHNLLVNAGAEAIEDAIGSGSGTSAFNYIGLCNSTAGCTAPASGDTAIDNEYTDSGLTRSQGTFGDNGVGNWSVWKTFTATADSLTTNLTGIYNASSGTTLLASNSFTEVTLQTSDQLTVNWTIWVTGA